MKKIFLLSLLLSGLVMGQDFFSDQAEESDQEFFDGTSAPDPDYGEDQGNSGENPGNPGDPPPKAPIDDWLFLLPIAGIVVGGYYLSIKYDVFVIPIEISLSRLNGRTG